MSELMRRVRGRPFQPGNPGRPRGSRNRVTQIAEQVVEAGAEQAIRKILQLGLAGDVSCLKIIADRVYPARRGQPINIVMPAINNPEDALRALAEICKALGEGVLTPDEITALSSVVGRSIQVIELQNLERRIAALEKSRAKRDAD
jgi:hypothetical protein